MCCSIFEVNSSLASYADDLAAADRVNDILVVYSYGNVEILLQCKKNDYNGQGQNPKNNKNSQDQN